MLFSGSAIGDLHDEAYEIAIVEVEDITSGSYSLEDAKLKDEEDNRKMAAERKKEQVREQISRLRTDFVEFSQKNSADADYKQRLSISEVVIDPLLCASLATEAKSKLEEVEKVMQWDSDYHRHQLEKLQAHYLGSLLVESITLHAFRSGHSVSSFRTLALDTVLVESLREIRSVVRDSTMELADSGSNAANLTLDLPNGSACGRGAVALTREVSTKIYDQSVASDTKGFTEALCATTGDSADCEHGWEARKAGRKVRKAQMALMQAERPSENAEDPKDVAAIHHAQQTMGDYKLKAAIDYVVPPSKRVNAEKKQKQCIMLEEALHAVMQVHHSYLN